MDTSTSSRTTSRLGYSFANLSPSESICPNRSKPNSLHLRLPANKKTKCEHKNFFISSNSECQMESQRPCIPANQKTRWKYKISLKELLCTCLFTNMLPINDEYYFGTIAHVATSEK